MPSIDSTSAAEDFEELRQVYRGRLPDERLHFLVLHDALAITDLDSARVFKELVHRAHRLRGGADIFQFFAIAAAAKDLELAAGAGVPTGASLIRLIDLMSDAQLLPAG